MENKILHLQNPINYLMDYFYNNKFILKKKTYQNKTINYFIGHLYTKTHCNNKFKKINIVFNPFCSFYFQRNISKLSLDEIDELMLKVDNKQIVNNKRFHLIEYYEKYPLNQYQFYSLKKYNFYDVLIFQYCTHKSKDRVYKEHNDYITSKLSITFD
tara:strand:- start:392 stop:862 length:471 start_codon:yes stop_codon:yes gene_type:complete